MNLYSKKQRWKIVLVIVAAVIVGVSLMITGNIVNKIKQDEKGDVKEWSRNVRNNVQTINASDSLLLQNKIANDLLIRNSELLIKSEVADVQEWADAMHELSNEYNDYSFFIKKIQSNDKIPLIVLNHKGEPSEWRNLSFDESVFSSYGDEKVQDSLFKDSLTHLADEWGKTRTPIELDYILNQKFRVYYTNSRAIAQLNEAIAEFEQKSEEYKNRSLALLNEFNTSLEKSIKLFPMVYVDAVSNEVISTNLEDEVKNDPKKLKAAIEEMKSEHEAIPVEIAGEVKGYIYYQNSELVKQLSYYPYIQFGIIGLFLLVSYFLFSTFRKAEQNQVWVGMAKETAHQLGTPISSLMAWTELLKSQGVDESVIVEINKDLNRLETVTDRFSKIGSGGELSSQSVGPVVERVYTYLEKRVSKKMTITRDCDNGIVADINEPLLEWVIENLSKNGIDAMEGEGSLHAQLSEEGDWVHLDISDTGKGIPGAQFKTVFEPGFTTKQRGWGLGLSLVKRIVEEYHHGKVFVLKSELNKGTTFRVSLKRSK